MRSIIEKFSLEKGIYLKCAFTLFVIGGVIALPKSILAQSNIFSQSAVPPIEIIGKYLVYKSGSVTKFERKKEYFITRTNEFYVHSRNGRTGMLSRANYANGELVLREVVSPEQRRKLVQSNPVYSTCGTILAPPVKFRISAVRAPGAGGYYRDRWDVTQATPICRRMNVRHHSKNNSCEVQCLETYKGMDNSYKNMRMYSRQDAAMTDARARPALLASGSAAAQNSEASWLNGLAMKTSDVQLFYSDLAERVGCCADDKAAIMRAFTGIEKAIAEAKTYKSKGSLCRHMTLLEMRIGYLKMWLQTLSLDSQQEKHRGSISAEDARKLKVLTDEVRRLSTSVKARQMQIGGRACQ